MFSGATVTSLSVTPLEKLVAADLLRAQRMMRAGWNGRDAEFHLASPDGDYWIRMRLSPAWSFRLLQFRMLWQFMGSRMVPGFTVATRLDQPDALACIVVTRIARMGLLSPIHGPGLSFGPPEALSAGEIGTELPDVLPKAPVSLTPAEDVAVESWFGASGQYPALRSDPAAITPLPVTRPFANA